MASPREGRASSFGSALSGDEVDPFLVTIHEEDKEASNAEQLCLLQKRRQKLQAELKELDGQCQWYKSNLIQKKEEEKHHLIPYLGTRLGLNGMTTSIMSGLLCGVLKFSFCIAFATIMFSEEDLKSSVSIGIGTQLISVIVTGLATSHFSECRYSIGGPDIVAAAFYSTMATTIVNNVDEKDEILPTYLLAIVFSTLVFAFVVGLLGSFRGSRVVHYLPISVLYGFLGSIGYKVAKSAFQAATGDHFYSPDTWTFWKLILPSTYGFLLYFLYKFHIGNFTVVLTILFFGPVLIFFIIVLATGSTLEDLRESGWLFEEVEGNFWEQYDEFSLSAVNGKAFFRTLPDQIVMIIILVIDVLLKLQSTKKIGSSGTEMDLDRELKLTGWENVFAALLVGVPGYSQIKFNVINYNIINNQLDRLPGYIVAIFCGMLFFVGLTLINYLPRFFLGALLLYAALGFIVPPLVDSYWKVSKKEFLAIWVIVVLNALTSLLVAVISGLVLAALIFALQYARVSIIRAELSGRAYKSLVIRPIQEQQFLEHVGCRFVLLELQHFIFFGTASQILEEIRSKLAKSSQLEYPRQIRYILFDFEHVYGMDWTGVSTFCDIMQFIGKQKPAVQVLFTGLTDKTLHKLEAEKVLSPRVKVFPTMEQGAEYVEDSMLARARVVRKTWLFFDSFKKLYTKALLKAAYESFEAVLDTHVSEELWKYVDPVKVKEGGVICNAGEFNYSLYLLHRGRVSTYAKDADGSFKRMHSMTRGAFINESSLFLDVPVSSRVVADTDSMLHKITRENLKRMEAKNPRLALAITRTVLKHTFTSREIVERELRLVNIFDTHVSSFGTAGGQIGGVVSKSVDGTRGRSTSIADDHHRFHHLGGLLRSAEQLAQDLDGASRGEVKEDTLLSPSRGHKRYKSLLQRSSSRGNLRQNLTAGQSTDVHLSNHQAAEYSSCFYAHQQRLGAVKARNIQKIAMDVGVFPTKEEMYESLPISRNAQRDILLPEFLQMMCSLTLAELSNTQVIALQKVFENYCDENGLLSRTALDNMMSDIDHQLGQLELEEIMLEWDTTGDQHLDLSNFLSMIAHYLKQEELDEQMEADFVRLALASNSDHAQTHDVENSYANLTDAQLASLTVSENDVVAMMNSLGSKQAGPRLVSEMVFDADLNEQGHVTLENLIATITTIHDDDISDLTKSRAVHVADEKGIVQRPPLRHTLSHLGRRSSFTGSKKNLLQSVSNATWNGNGKQESPPTSPEPVQHSLQSAGRAGQVEVEMTNVRAKLDDAIGAGVVSE